MCPFILNKKLDIKLNRESLVYIDNLRSAIVRFEQNSLKLIFIFFSEVGHHKGNPPNHQKQGPSNYRKQDPSNPQNRGPSNYHKQEPSNPQKQGPSNYHKQGASNYHKQGASDYLNEGASSPHKQDISGHQFKRSISESIVKPVDGLPMISPDIDSMDLYSDEKRLVERIRLEQKIDVKYLQLDEKSQRMYNDNPHLREVFLNKELIKKYDKDFTRENRLLITRIQRPGSSSIIINPKKCSTTEHWGQRKLLLTEIEFLTNYGSDDDYLVIYAGAAPGSHLTYLSSLFPQLGFVLIDDKEFTLKLTDKIKIRSEKFTHDIAQRYSDSNRKVLFICNVRTYRPQGDGQNDGIEDMQNQMDWYRLMKPHAALLNFRLPRGPGKTRYLKGHQIIEPWASRRATECRLIVKKDAKEIEYDQTEFEENLIDFHYGTRVMYYKHNMDEVENEGLDHCYDCRTEIYILQEYLTKVQKVKDEKSFKLGIAKMSSDISKSIDDKKRPRFIDTPRTLNVIPKKSTNTVTNL
jgi:hypothetical protein